MTLAEVMTPTVVTVSMDDTLRNIRKIFNQHKFHHVVVVDAGKAVGVISDRDVLKHLSPFVGKLSERAQDADSLNRRAHQIMSRQLIAAAANTSIADAIELMIARDISCLVVLDERARCIGIVTSRDMLRWCNRCAITPGGAVPDAPAATNAAA